MAKSKRGTALFDLLAHEEAEGTAPLKLPTWWNRKDAMPKAHAAESDIPAPARERGETTAPRSPDGERKVPWFEIAGDRIRISLTSVTAAVPVFAVLAVALGAFELGQTLGHRAGFRAGAVAGRAAVEAEALSDIEYARQQQPALEVVSDLLEDPVPAVVGAPAGDASARAKRAGWVRGHTYVVAQEFSRGRVEDAQMAQAFLRQQGINTELIQYPTGSLQLITVDGYNRDDAVQRRMADDLLEKVRSAGAKYFAGGGGYKLEGYFKTLKTSAWIDGD